MTIDDKIRDEKQYNKSNTILTKKQQKYQLYHLKKSINMSFLQVKKRKVIERTNFIYFPLEKAFEK